MNLHKVVKEIVLELGYVNKEKGVQIAQLLGVAIADITRTLTELVDTKQLQFNRIHDRFVVVPIDFQYEALYIYYIYKSLNKDSSSKPTSTKPFADTRMHKAPILTPEEKEILDWFEQLLANRNYYIKPDWRKDQTPDAIGITKIASLKEWKACYEWTRNDSWWKTKSIVKISTLKKAWNSYKATRQDDRAQDPDNSRASRKKRSRIEAEAN